MSEYLTIEELASDKYKWVRPEDWQFRLEYDGHAYIVTQKAHDMVGEFWLHFYVDNVQIYHVERWMQDEHCDDKLVLLYDLLERRYVKRCVNDVREQIFGK